MNAKELYDAYATQVGGTSHDGKPLPKYEELGERQQWGWVAVARKATNIESAINVGVFVCHEQAALAGWWVDPKTGVSIKENPYCFSNKLMLTVSELSEAMEGDRKNLMDDKLPHRPMREVELADAVIRIFDLAGAYGMDLGGAVREKLAFNAQRPDHKLANRQAAGGKSY